MTYSMKNMPNKQSEFPPPPLWLIWREERTYNNQTNKYEFKGQGQVRHMETLEKAKRGVYKRGGRFWTDWSIWEWTGKKYVKRYEGFRNDPSAEHPLFQKGAVKKEDRVRAVDEDDMNEALASILGVMTP